MRAPRGPRLARRAVCLATLGIVASLPVLPTAPVRAAEEPPPAILPFSEVRAGMKGRGLTVFRGGRIEEFDVEILGKMENIGPGQNMILARLSGGPLAETGVIEGMSGSPVLVDGRMIGAIAYSWGFSRDAVAGLTPVEEMLALESRAGTGRPPTASDAVRLPRALRSHEAALDGRRLAGLYAGRLSELFSPPALEPAGMQPVAIPLALSGLSARAVARLGGDRFSASVQGSGTEADPSGPLRAGSAVGVALVDGDIRMTAIGTVTRRDGDRILAFGHPLFNLGPVELPLTHARVETLLPSLRSSFKFARAGQTAGAVLADGVSGVLARAGARARTIPVRVELAASGGRSRRAAFEIADHPLLSPVLVFLTLGGLLDSVESAGGDVTVELMEGSVLRLSGERRVALANLFAGDQAVLVSSATVAFLTQILMENEFEGVRIEGINLVARTSRQRRVARITAAWSDRSQARPGERVTLRVALKPYRGDERVIPLTLDIPDEIGPGRLTLTVGNALALHRSEAEGTGGIYPRDLDHLVRLINNLRRSERIYVLATREEPSVWMGDRALPNLPPSKASVILSPESRGNFPVLRTRPVFEQDTPTGYVIQGSRRLEMEIVP